MGVWLLPRSLWSPPCSTCFCDSCGVSAWCMSFAAAFTGELRARCVVESQLIPAWRWRAVGKKKRTIISLFAFRGPLYRTSLVADSFQRDSSDYKRGARLFTAHVLKNSADTPSSARPNMAQSARNGPGSEAERLPPSRLECNAQIPDAGTVGLEVALAQTGCGTVFNGGVIGKKKKLDVINKAKELPKKEKAQNRGARG